MCHAICVHMQQGPSCNGDLCLLFAIRIRVRQYLTNQQHKNKQQTNKSPIIKRFIHDTNICTLHTHAVLHRFYMFRRHLRHPHAVLHQDLKLTKVQYIKKVIHIILQYSCS
jgi:hypothetical protein